jgi:hypothetical protein
LQPVFLDKFYASGNGQNANVLLRFLGHI